MTQGSISALIAKQWKVESHPGPFPCLFDLTISVVFSWSLYWLGLQNWSNGKQREKVNNTVLFYQATHDKLIAEFPKYTLITPFVLSKRFWVTSLTQIFFLLLLADEL
jgi:hypothetical protein